MQRMRVQLHQTTIFDWLAAILRRASALMAANEGGVGAAAAAGTADLARDRRTWADAHGPTRRSTDFEQRSRP